MSGGEPKNLAFVVHGPTGEFYNKESGFVIKSKETRVVIGRLRDGSIEPLKDSDIPDLKSYRFQYEMPSLSTTSKSHKSVIDEFFDPFPTSPVSKAETFPTESLFVSKAFASTKPNSINLPSFVPVKRKIGEAKDVVNVIAEAVSGMIDDKKKKDDEEDEDGRQFLEEDDKKSDEEIEEED
jgi:hypothetical protein